MKHKKKILVLVDKKASSNNQAVGLTNSIIKQANNKFEKKIFIINNYKFRFFPNFFLFFFLRIGLISFNFKLDFSTSLIISCGRVCAPVSVFLKKKLKCKNIHILKPYFQESFFDKCIIPHHDNYKVNKNIIFNRFSFINEEKKNISNEELKIFKEMIPILNGKKKITVLVGGNSKSSNFSLTDINKFIKNLLKIDLKRFQLFILFSRRTSKDLKNNILRYFKDSAYIWDENSKNPYWFLIKNSDFFIVTSDSVSMTSEAVSSKKPVFIFNVSNSKRKIEKFQNFLIKNMITRNFDGNIFAWKYKKINESNDIARLIIKDLELS